MKYHNWRTIKTIISIIVSYYTHENPFTLWLWCCHEVVKVEVSKRLSQVFWKTRWCFPKLSFGREDFSLFYCWTEKRHNSLFELLEIIKTLYDKIKRPQDRMSTTWFDWNECAAKIMRVIPWDSRSGFSNWYYCST